jgi:CRP-like cAMP-binding protein
MCVTVPRPDQFMPTSRLDNSASLVEASSLSTVDLFSGLPAECLRALEDGSEVRDVPAGRLIFRTGDTGQRLFVLEKGAVHTYRMSGRNKLIIAELQPPAIFGEMAFVGQSLYHCSAETTEPARIRVLERSGLDVLLDQYPVITRRLLELVSERFVRVLLDLESTSFRQLVPRIALLLLDRAQDDTVENLTHKDIAGRLRVYRESVTSALGELRRAGILAIDRKCIRILDRPRLERASRE